MVIFYSTRRGKPGERLLKIIQTVVPGKETKICRDIDALSKVLQQPRITEAIAILHAAGRSELPDIFSLRELLWNIKLILVLPNSSTDTVAKGHGLGPRFISYHDGNFQDVAAVLKRMIGNLETNH